MTSFRLSCVVEGHGEVKAVPVLLRRIVREMDSTLDLDVPAPIRRPRGSLLQTAGELERAVELAGLKARPRGGILVLIDGDDDCPAELGPGLLARAAQASVGLPVSVVVAHREFETWFVAAAESLRGRRGLPADLTTPAEPERIRGAKEWLRRRMSGGAYAETIDQPALAAVFDLSLARKTRSFQKCYREVGRLIEACRG